MQLFITGATGSVGQAVVPHLLAGGSSVTALVRRTAAIDGCRVIESSLQEIDRVAGEIAACDAIVHLACARSVNSTEVLQQDIAGTAGLIEAWRKGPFVYASSSTVHGYPLGVLNEQAAIELWNWYDQGKYANELQIRLAEHTNGRGGAIILRPALIFAINGRRHDRQMLSEIFVQCQLGSRFVFESDDALARYGCAFIGGADFGRVVAAALKGNLSGIYNIAGGFCTWRELIEMFNRFAGTKGDFVVRADTQPKSGEYRLAQSRTELDTTAFAQATGFAPQETLGELVEAFVQAERASAPA